MEYSGPDTVNPLDSVSGASSLSTGLLLNSGFAALSSTTVVAFGGGLTDSNYTPTPGSNFVLVKSTSGATSPGAITEEDIFSGTPSALPLQAATAGPATGTSSPGNWIMQMAAFRAATSMVAGGWSPVRPPDEVNAAQYPGVDICVQAQNAGIANPYATILMPINGSVACSVDPTGAASTSPIVSAPFQGKLKLVAVGSSPAQINMDTPWVFFNNSMTLDGGSVQFSITQPFLNNWSAKRCWTEGSADSTDFGACATGGIGNGFQIQVGGSVPTNCALITYPGSTGPYEIRGGEIVNLTGMSDLRNNGVFRVIPAGATPCTGTSGPTATQFYIWAPSAQNCTGFSGCGSSATLAAQTAMFYMGPRAFDNPTNSMSNSCIKVNGGDYYGGNGENCNRFGIKLLNLGELDGWGYGLEGIDNSQCNEQCVVDSYGAHTIYRVSMLTYGQWSSVSLNNDSIRHFEDYCNNNTNSTNTFYCLSYTNALGVNYYYGAFHVGVWLRDTWNHGAVQDATINEPAYAGIMLDGMTGYSSGISIKGIHFQNGGSKPPPSGGNWGGNLANIAIGAQASASSVYIEQIESNMTAGVAANILIASPSNAPPLNLPDWQANSNGGSCMGPPNVCFTYPIYAAILPTAGTNNKCSGNPCVFEASLPDASGGSVPNWGVAVGMCTSPESTGLIWCNVGPTLPNSTGPGGNVVKTIEVTNHSGDTPTIYNGVTNTTWTRNAIADYTFDNQGTTYEESSSDTYPSYFGQGINFGGVPIIGGTCTGTCAPPAVCLNTTGSTSSTTLYTCTSSGGWGAISQP